MMRASTLSRNRLPLLLLAVALMALVLLFAPGAQPAQAQASSNADLSALTVQGSTDGTTFAALTGANAMAPAFAAATLDYRVTVGNATTHVKLTPTAADTGASLAVGRSYWTSLPTVTSGSASDAIELAEGDNEITVRVVAADGSPNFYEVIVRRVPAAAVWHATLVVRDMTSDFSGLGCNELSSDASHHCSDASTLTANTFTRGGATRTIQGLGLLLGDLYLNLTGTGPNGAKAALSGMALNVDGRVFAVSDSFGANQAAWSSAGFTWSAGQPVSLSLTASPNANLSALAVSSSDSATGTFNAVNLAPLTFSAATRTYTATVAHNQTHAKVTPTVDDTGRATVGVGKAGSTLTTVTSGSASDAIALDLGVNAITVRVTAENGATQDYTVTITRRYPVYVSNLGETAETAGVATGAQSQSQAFTTGPEVGAYTLGRVDVILLAEDITSDQRDSIRAELWASVYGGDDAGKPEYKIADLTVPAHPIATGTVSFAAPPDTSLAAGTTYHVVFYTVGAFDMAVVNTESGAEDSFSTPGWSMADGRRSARMDRPTPTSSWSDEEDEALMIAVYAAPGSPNTNLGALALGSSDSATGTFDAVPLSPPAFRPVLVQYRATVDNDQTHVRVTPTVEDTGKATVKVGRTGTTLTTVASGSASGAIPLSVGTNDITMRVTAENGATKEYKVIITRQAQTLTTTVWSATLTVSAYGTANVVRGCDNAFTATGEVCSATSNLTDDDFTFEGVSYQVVAVQAIVSSPGLNFVFNKAFPANLKSAGVLVVDGTEYALASGSTLRTSVNTNDQLSISGFSHSWEAGDTVSLSLKVLPTSLTLEQISVSGAPTFDGEGNWQYGSIHVQLRPRLDQAISHFDHVVVDTGPGTTAVRSPDPYDPEQGYFIMVNDRTPFRPGYDVPTYIGQVWRGELLVRGVDGSHRGCRNGTSWTCEGTDALTDRRFGTGSHDEFTYRGTDYAITEIEIRNTADPITNDRALLITFDTALTPELLLTGDLIIDGTRLYFTDAVVSNNNRTVRWAETGLSWSNNDRVDISLGASEDWTVSVIIYPNVWHYVYGTTDRDRSYLTKRPENLRHNPDHNIELTAVSERDGMKATPVTLNVGKLIQHLRGGGSGTPCPTCVANRQSGPGGDGFPNSAPIVVAPLADVSDLAVGGSRDLLLAGVFVDRDADPLTITAKSSNDTVVQASVSSDQGTLQLLGVTAGTVTVTVTADDGNGNQASDAFEVTVAATGGEGSNNNLGSMPESPHADLIADIRDWRDDPCCAHNKEHTDRWDRALKALGEEVEDQTLEPMTADEAQTYVDKGWERWEGVVDALRELENRAPTVSNPLGDFTFLDETGNTSVSLSGVFSDPDGDTLTITAASDDEAAATVEVAPDYSALTVTAQARGTATITVTASDGNGGTVDDTFTVTVKAAPVVASAISDVSGLEVEGEQDVSMSGVFRDPDGDSLTITASSSDDTKATVAVASDGSKLTLTGVAVGTATITVTAEDSDGNTVSDAFDVAVVADAQQQATPNRAPTVSGAIPDATIVSESGTHQVSLSGVFDDADYDNLTITAESSDETRATVSVATGYLTLTVSARSRGTAIITVTADDGRGGTVDDEFTVTVKAAPVVASAIADVSGLEVEGEQDVSMSGVFSDPDGDTLTITAASSDDTVASVFLFQGILTLLAVQEGSATITVTAEDSDGNTVSDTFEVEVVKKYAGLIADMYQWRNDPCCAHNKEHTDRWDRTLKTFGETVTDTTLTKMTADEAQEYVDRGWERWVPVTAALRELEGG